MKNLNIKKIATNLLIVGVLCSTAVSIFAIMAGGVNDVVGKSIATIILLIAHSMILLGLISLHDIKPKKGNDRTLTSMYPATIYITTVLVVLSTIFSITGVWTEGGEMVAKFYASFIVVALAALPAEALFRIGNLNNGHLKPVGLSASGAIFLLATMLVFGIWFEFDNLDEIYGRATASAGVLASSLAVLTMVLYFIHLRSDKKAQNVLVSGKRGEVDIAAAAIITITVAFFMFPIGAAIVGSLVEYIDESDSGYIEDEDCDYNRDGSSWCY